MQCPLPSALNAGVKTVLTELSNNQTAKEVVCSLNYAP